MKFWTCCAHTPTSFAALMTGRLSIGLAAIFLATSREHLCFANALERSEANAATPTPTVIHAPNVASDSMKASGAIRGYLEASKARDSVYQSAVEARSMAPAMYGEHLGRVLKAQNSTLTALDKAATFQATAVDTAQTELRDLQTEYGQKEQDLASGRTGADFGAEAQDLKLRMGR
mmetsp:Transcript_41644/g.120631  ORF Transcript_41644/g.120631 Transcript_41644/m.120631 type:complete len:176 (-) Transcript_41644:58-585(-)